MDGKENERASTGYILYRARRRKLQHRERQELFEEVAVTATDYAVVWSAYSEL